MLDLWVKPQTELCDSQWNCREQHFYCIMFSTFPFVQKFQNFGIFLSKCELCSSLVYKGYLLNLLRTVCLSYPKQKILKETGTWMISSVSILFLWQVVSLVVCTITLEILGILISLPLESCIAWFARATRWGLIFSRVCWIERVLHGCSFRVFGGGNCYGGTIQVEPLRCCFHMPLSIFQHFK